jgi:threonine/homoserine/homoserine lactone efflux protein
VPQIAVIATHPPMFPDPGRPRTCFPAGWSGGRAAGPETGGPGEGCVATVGAVITFSQAAAFSVAAMALLVIPGPSVLFVVTRGVALGRHAALATVAGNELGAACHVVLVAFGVGALVQRSLLVFTVMKLAGAAYLVWLGVRAVRHRRRLSEALGAPVATRGRRRLVGDGFLVGVSNPKTTLFFLSVLPQFVDPDRGHVTAQLLALGTLFVVLATLNDGLYGLAAGSARRWFDRSPRRAEAVGGVSGLVMIGLGVRLALTGRRD